MAYNFPYFHIQINERLVFPLTFQNGVEVKPNKDLRIYAMGRKRFLQIMKCQVQDSGIYTCDAGDAATSCTVEVYGKVGLLFMTLSSLQRHSAMLFCLVELSSILYQDHLNQNQVMTQAKLRPRQDRVSKKKYGQ